jgi:predicted ATPase
MRIAFCGSHRVGKSTLLEQVARALPDHATVDEPYHLLEEDGYEHADPPSVEDFEADLARALEAVAAEDGPRVLFDRCPVDAVAYLLCHDDAAAFELEAWLPRIRAAMATIDLVVFVPIEPDDPIPLAADDDRSYRRAVHDQLEALLIEDALGLDPEVLVVHGGPGARAAQVLARRAAR